MFHKVLKSFPYYLDGIHQSDYLAGGSEQIKPDHVEGLAKAGYIEGNGFATQQPVDEEMQKAAVPYNNDHPGASKGQEGAHAQHGGGGTQINGAGGPNGNGPAANEESDPEYRRGFELGAKTGENSFSEEDKANEKLMNGYKAGLSQFRSNLSLDKWEELEWAELRVLAGKLSDEPVKSKADAEEAIKNEIARREEAAAKTE